MFIEDELPVEFYALTGSVAYVQRKSDNEYSSSCPNCHGEPHDDGTWPNRFVMWRASRLNGEPFGLCRKCGYKWSTHKQDAKWTAEERAEFEAKRKEFEAQRLAALDKLVQEIAAQDYYDRYYEEMKKNAAAKEYWYKRGYNDEWLEYTKKGYLENYTVKNHLTSYRSPAYTLPIFTFGDRIENIKLRVANPIDSNDRFRNIYRSGGQHLYVPRHDLKEMPDTVIVAEGEVKSDIIQMYGADDYIVVGWQSKSPEARIYDLFEKCGLIYLALDPDAYVPDNKVKSEPAVIRSAKKLGIERVRLIVPPCDCKFDDAILQGYRFQNALNMAIKPQAWKYWSNS